MKSDLYLDKLKESLLRQEGVRGVSIKHDPFGLNPGNEITYKINVSVRVLPSRRKDMVDLEIKRCFSREVKLLKSKLGVHLNEISLNIDDREEIFDPPL